MNTLVFNVGSSSIKYKVYSGSKELIKGNIERVKDFSSGFKEVVKDLFDHEIKVDAIGHRVVHGGDLTESKIITKDILKKIEKYSPLAPLHNIPEVKIIKECMKNFKAKNVAVFDTSFFAKMPEESRVYAIPYEYYKRGVKRYGFHGTSHNYVFNEAKKKLRKKASKVITCHLGNGCSITAIKNGKPIAHSLGFTPLAGLVMGTRSGDVDPSIIFYLLKKRMKADKIEKMLNKESGLLGLSGISNDMRDLLKKQKTNKRAKLAINIFIRRIVEYIGSYHALLGGLDAIIFAGGMGERSSIIRDKILSEVKHLGKFKSLVVHTDEELMIAREVKRILRK